MFEPKLLALMFPWLPGHERRLSRSVDWVDAGITADPNWRELFFLQLMYGRTTTQVLPRVFTRQELVSVAAPTLLIVGDHEVIYRPDQVVEAAAGLMPRIRTVVVPGANHIAALVQPYIVNRLILDFLNEVVS
jgi:pimeloyl-ACP methyl ester carboxylesterase